MYSILSYLERTFEAQARWLGASNAFGHIRMRKLIYKSAIDLTVLILGGPT